MASPIIVLDQPSQLRSLFSKFDEIKHPIISEFTASIPEKFADAVGYIGSRKAFADNNIIHNRAMLKSFIEKFHREAGTITTGIENSIALLDDPTTQILVSTHQPNLFAYGGVFKKIALLENLKNTVEKSDKSKKILNLFLIVDHDFIDESWIRLAQLPSMQHSSGVMELRFPISESKRWHMVCNIPSPAHIVIENWKRQVKSRINKCTIDIDKKLLVSNVEQFWRHVEISYSRAKSYADLNSFIMSRIVNEEWKYSTLFVRLSEISSVFENGFEFLISNFSTYSDALRRTESIFLRHNIDTGVSSTSHLQAPVWVHCGCGSKASARIAKDAGRLTITGPCISCKKELELNLGSLTRLDLNKAVNHLSPRAIPIPLLLSRELGVSCYASGTGGIGYLIDGSVVSKKLGLQLPLVLVWPSRDIYEGIGQREALRSMHTMKIDSINEYIQNLARLNAEYAERMRPLLKARTEKIKAGEPVKDLLAELFKLKEEQRKIRLQLNIAEKIRNAVNLSPCIIDYAINFGIDKVERNWRNHLLEKGDFGSPVFFYQST
jgi:hypothetical protein